MDKTPLIFYGWYFKTNPSEYMIGFLKSIKWFFKKIIPFDNQKRENYTVNLKSIGPFVITF